MSEIADAKNADLRLNSYAYWGDVNEVGKDHVRQEVLDFVCPAQQPEQLRDSLSPATPSTLGQCLLSGKCAPSVAPMLSTMAEDQVEPEDTDPTPAMQQRSDVHRSKYSPMSHTLSSLRVRMTGSLLKQALAICWFNMSVAT